MAKMTFMKLIRSTRGMTLEDVQKAASKNKIDYTKFHFSRIENAQYIANKATREFLAKFYDFNPNALFVEGGKTLRITEKRLRKFEKLLLRGAKKKRTKKKEIKEKGAKKNERDTNSKNRKHNRGD